MNSVFKTIRLLIQIVFQSFCHKHMITHNFTDFDIIIRQTRESYHMFHHIILY